MNTEVLDQAIRFELGRRADRGIDWLNDNDPGWLDRIEVALLDMENGSSCVLGQLGGSYRDYTDRVSVPTAACGFVMATADVMDAVPYVPLTVDAEDDVYRHIRTTGYPVLTEVWKERITALQAA